MAKKYAIKFDRLLKNAKRWFHKKIFAQEYIRDRAYRQQY